MFNFVFLCPKRWFQFNSRIVRTHFSCMITLNNWKMIAETRSYIFRSRSRFRRRRVCLSSLVLFWGRSMAGDEGAADHSPPLTLLFAFGLKASPSRWDTLRKTNEDWQFFSFILRDDLSLTSSVWFCGHIKPYPLLWFECRNQKWNSLVKSVFSSFGGGVRGLLYFCKWLSDLWMSFSESMEHY